MAGDRWLLKRGEIDASIDFKKGKKDTSSWRRYTGENELLFDILIGDLAEPVYPEKGEASWSIDKLRGEYRDIFGMTQWLCNKQLNYINKDCLFQYDNYLEYWCLSCFKLKETDAVAKRKAFEDWDLIQEGLYRIYHFDTEKEGDTCRTRFIHKMRRILDEREFIPEFKQMWLDIKSNKINVEEPWNIHWKPKPKKPRLP
ncbi:hypothetical protein [Spartinivicinus poritis]|uniref:Uncharacterized protein n=1 Tax=Spartinivicinus poritis TaxID=2994640 RepID=A0ABT5U8J2_9GAMM|nr:hypothetical protein [Spartinivicinus sp. A2-2]MDE1462686.1 hypothetical protein [Spartinivicinus sp. A2-2]